MNLYYFRKKHRALKEELVALKAENEKLKDEVIKAGQLIVELGAEKNSWRWKYSVLSHQYRRMSRSLS